MPAKEYVPMKMKDSLSAVFTGIRNQTKALFQFFRCDDILQRTVHGDCGSVVEIEHVFHMLSRYQQNMTRSNRVNVSERKRVFISINLRRGNFSCDQSAKKAIFHSQSP